MLAVFKQPRHLRAMGRNFLRETEMSGEPELKVPYEDAKVGKLRQRALELSNVNIIHEMVEMMMNERSFKMMVGAISGSGDMIKATLDIPR